MNSQERRLQVLVVYYRRFGALKLLAECIAQGARRAPNVNVTLLRKDQEPVHRPRPGETSGGLPDPRTVMLSQLAGADALIVGSPAYFGSMAATVKRLFEDCLAFSSPPSVDRSCPWRQSMFRDTVGAAFATSGTPVGPADQPIPTPAPARAPASRSTRVLDPVPYPVGC